MKNNNLLTFVLAILVWSLSLGGFGYYAFSKNDRFIKTESANPSPNTNTLKSEEAKNWKTYKNEEFGFEFSYPQYLELDFQNRGFISGSDYYGKRDFNVLVKNAEIEPSHPGHVDGNTGKQVFQYDGYNIAIFSGESAVNHIKNHQEMINQGYKYSPPLEFQQIYFNGQENTLYFVPASDQPNTSKISFWFTFFENGDRTFIVTGNYDRNTLTQILSTFKFTGNQLKNIKSN